MKVGFKIFFDDNEEPSFSFSFVRSFNSSFIRFLRAPGVSFCVLFCFAF